MRKVMVFIAVLTVVVFQMGCKKTSSIEEYSDGDFVEMMDSLDLNASENTSLNVKTKWAELQGKQVVWDGEVVDVRGGRGRVEIKVKKEGKPLYEGYNVVVTTFDETRAGKLKKGEEVTFKGLLENKKQRKGRPLIIYIGSAELVD